VAFPVKGPTSVRRITAPDPPSDSVATRFAGELKFRGGFPSEETVPGIYDELDFQRGCCSVAAAEPSRGVPLPPVGDPRGEVRTGQNRPGEMAQPS
jgi:hypothetical protein